MYLVEGRSEQGRTRYLELRRTSEQDIWANMTNGLGEERCVWWGNFDEFISRIKTLSFAPTRITFLHPNVIAGASYNGRKASFELCGMSDAQDDPKNFNPKTGKWEDCGITIRNGGVIRGWGQDWWMYVTYADFIKTLEIDE